ncbi:unnamed protein product, partial [Callosobruchus maculatus]
MENGESPLDVLSTVASIVQESQTPLSPSPSPTGNFSIDCRMRGLAIPFSSYVSLSCKSADVWGITVILIAYSGTLE